MIVADFKDQKASREGFGKGIVEAATKNKNVVALSADLSESLKLEEFKKRFPDRYFDVGVAEQNLAGVAAGLALEGKIPFITSFASFSPSINWGQLRVSICYNKANVKIVGSHAGITTGEDGATHQALEDIALTRVLPGMNVIVPADALEAERATVEISKTKNPTYLRLGRERFPQVTMESGFKIGKANVLKEGDDLTIIACGNMVFQCLKAVEELEKNGIKAELINNHTIKPIDSKTIIDSAAKTGRVFTVEEHQVNGGMGSAVSEVLSGEKIPVYRIGVEDKFGTSGSASELLDFYGLSSYRIKQKIENIFKKYK
jgi:transketolase